MSTMPSAAPNAASRAAVAAPSWANILLRCAASVLLVGAYYWIRGVLEAGTPRILVVVLLLLGLVGVWWRWVTTDPRFQGPLLITTILAVGDAALSFLENPSAPPWLVNLTGGFVTAYSPTFITILISILAEVVLGRFYWGKWPHLASAYISGISAGILIKSHELWPFVLCGLISITSKYVLRLAGRHLWNPTNFGVTMMLFLAPASVAPLSQQAGNNGLAIAVIWLLGGMIMYRLKLWHIPITFVAAFVPLAVLRSYILHDRWQTEMAPITSPMFQLFIFFMITDPKTITRGWRRQVVVVLLVAVMETVLRLAFKDLYSLFHALFIVGPIANVVEIYFDRKEAKAKASTSPPATTEPLRAEPPAVVQTTGG